MNTRHGTKSVKLIKQTSDDAQHVVKCQPKLCENSGATDTEEDELAEREKALAEKVCLMARRKCLTELERRKRSWRTMGILGIIYIYMCVYYVYILHRPSIHRYTRYYIQLLCICYN